MSKRNLVVAAAAVLFATATFSSAQVGQQAAEPDYMATEFVWLPSERTPDTMATEFLWLPAERPLDLMATEFLWLPTKSTVIASN